MSGPPLEAVLPWVAAGCSVRALTSEIQDAATRISGLVQSAKGFTHMDQAMVAEPLDLTLNLATRSPYSNQRRAKSIAVAMTVEPDLPLVRGFVGEGAACLPLISLPRLTPLCKE